MSVRVEIRMPDDMHKQVKEDAGKNKVTITDIILDALSDKYLAEGKKPPTKDMPALPKSPVASNSEGKKPAKTPDKAPEAGKPLANGYIPKSAAELRATHKLTHPLDICPGCSQFNQGCQCGATVYVPDPVRPAKQPKVSASKAIQPIVKAMLSGIVKQPTASHHPCCLCGVCKPLSDKLSRL